MTLEDARARDDWSSIRGRLLRSDYGRLADRYGIGREEARTLRADLLRELGASRVETVGDAIQASGTEIHTLEQLLDAAAVDRERWRVTRWVANHWADQWQVKAWLAARESWEAALPPLDLSTGNLIPEAGATVVALGDAQIGFLRDAETGSMLPLHDEAALAGALAVVEMEHPDVVVVLGDMLDLAPWSTRYTHAPGMAHTTRASLKVLRELLRRLAAHCGRLVYIEGNHEGRILRAIRERLPEAEGLLTVPGLLGVEGLDYRGPYPSGEVWIDGVRYHHGETVRQGGGATVAAGLRGASASQVHGHIHRRETAYRTIHEDGGTRTIYAHSPGCLCHVDGRVPGDARPDWQHGVAVVRGGRLV